MPSSGGASSSGPRATSGSSTCLFLLSQVVLLVTLGLYARYGARFTRESAAGRIGTGMLLGMLGFGFVWLSQLGFGLAELWWQRRTTSPRRATSNGPCRTGACSAASSSSSAWRSLIVMGLAGPVRRSLVDPRVGGLHRARCDVRLRLPVAAGRRHGAPARPAARAPRRSASSASRASTASPCGWSRSPTTRRSSTPTPRGSGRRGASSSGTRCSTTSRRARSRSCSPTRSATTRATTSSRASPGTRSSRSPART